MMLKLLLVILVSTQAFIPIRRGLRNIKLTNVLKAPNVATTPIERSFLVACVVVSSINAEEKELLGEYNEETNDNFEFDKILNEVSKEEAGTRRVFVENLDSKVSWQALKVIRFCTCIKNSAVTIGDIGSYEIYWDKNCSR